MEIDFYEARLIHLPPYTELSPAVLSSMLGRKVAKSPFARARTITQAWIEDSWVMIKVEYVPDDLTEGGSG